MQESVLNLSAAVTAANSPLPEPQPEGYVPKVCHTIEDTGVAPTLIEALILKTLHFRGEMIGRDLADFLGLKFSLIEPLLDAMRRQRHVDVKTSLGYGMVSSVLMLAENGRFRARELLEANQYYGPTPVPLDQYTMAVREQRQKSGWLTRAALESAYSHMVTTPHMISQIGPAVNSGKSLLLYGQPGNGKTYLAEALFHIESKPVYVPYAIEYHGQIIKVYDPVYHFKIEEAPRSVTSLSFEPAYDGRWALCKRPFIVTGGELTLDMLNLSYFPTAKIYNAPFQVKANNGIYLVDDFGRQQCSPSEILNRWIIPMDRRVDFLSFVTGGKIEMPFENFLIFSTNMRPDRLGDEAFLRRIEYKLYMGSPTRAEYREIFRRYCEMRAIGYDPVMVERLLDHRYAPTKKPFRRCHPRDLVSHAIDLIDFEKLAFELTDDLLDRAFESCFAEADHED